MGLASSLDIWMENYIVKPISSRIYAVHQHHPHHHPPPLIPCLIHYTGYCCCSCFCCCSSVIQYYRIWCYFNISNRVSVQLSLVSISLFGTRQFILLTKTTIYRLTTTSFCHSFLHSATSVFRSLASQSVAVNRRCGSSTFLYSRHISIRRRSVAEVESSNTYYILIVPIISTCLPS